MNLEIITMLSASETEHWLFWLKEIVGENRLLISKSKDVGQTETWSVLSLIFQNVLFNSEVFVMCFKFERLFFFPENYR